MSNSAAKRFQAVQLPLGSIVQNASAQGVSSATAALYEYTLSHYPNSPLKVLEAGSGSGVLSIMLAQQRPFWSITALELQSALHTLAVQNTQALGLRMELINADLREFTADNPCDLILSNPPWQKVGSGLISPNRERAISRSELCCSLCDVLGFCVRNLLNKGHALLLYPQSRKQEVCELALSMGLELTGIHAADNASYIFDFYKRISL